MLILGVHNKRRYVRKEVLSGVNVVVYSVDLRYSLVLIPLRCYLPIPPWVLWIVGALV